MTGPAGATEITQDMLKAGAAVLLYELEDAETPPPVCRYTAEEVVKRVFAAMEAAKAAPPVP